HNGQTVEIVTAKEGGPSRDWLNTDLGYMTSHRGRSKVRAWFNAQAMNETIGRGREAVEKLLQREGKTAVRLEELAGQLGFKSADALFEVVGKDEFSLRNIEAVLRPPEPAPELHGDDQVVLKKPRHNDKASQGGVLVVGIGSLMTQLAKCCKPAPPDAIGGFVTRGKGVSVHRADCSTLREMAARTPERVIAVDWDEPKAALGMAVYPVDVIVQGSDRPGLLRDMLDVLAKEKVNVIDLKTHSLKGSASVSFTAEVPSAARLNKVLAVVAAIPDVRMARRR
ncbi:MAG: bifunctional (p)ppGpp synthetase/guanosine-3',5'-bis(diphosphate) 3'-pyrophosphohydrolase, partial [Giesbergeria sp.]|nr:bifunctional (p)ppGpp synthetase/guanosine-3',5'-bis(diphosphate) 3'-pyrophosphohydrolase [Giesbergeria sp.]